MKTSKFEIHEKYTKDIKQEITDLINSLKIPDDEEVGFKTAITSRYFKNEEEHETTYFAITNNSFVSQCQFTGSREYTNIKANWIHTPTLRSLLKEVKKICEEKKK